MKRQLLMSIFMLLSLAGYAQIRFEKGYFIDNTGKRTEVLIKNSDWKNNPSEFEYKFAEGDAPIIASVAFVQEFGIGNSLKYKRFRVNIDRSSDNLNSLSKSRGPEFSEEQLFLKEFLEGQASLYEYEGGGIKRYFFSVGDAAVEQLVYKKYLVTQGREQRVAKNELYKQQLWNLVKCESFTMKEVNNTSYNKKDLLRYFQAYNSCNSAAITVPAPKQKRDFFNLRITPGIAWSSLNLENVSTPRDPNFGVKTGFRLGVEAEFVLPFNKNKWAIIIEPGYQQYRGEHVMRIQTARVNYHSVEIPLGIRHYFFLNDKNKVFITGAYVLPFAYNSTVTFENELDGDLEMFSISNFALGAGYSYNSTYSIELRAYSNRAVVNYSNWKSRYSNVSLVFGLKLF